MFEKKKASTHHILQTETSMFFNLSLKYERIDPSVIEIASDSVNWHIVVTLNNSTTV